MNAPLLANHMSNYYDQTYMTTSTDTVNMSPAAFLGFMFFSLLLFVAIYVVFSYFLSLIFKKAGVASWKAWVPVYNSWIMLELGGQKGFWAILAFVPLVNIVSAVFMYIAMYQIGLNLGKDGVFVLLAIFLPLVWVIWLGVDKSTWQPTSGASVTQVPPASTNSSPPIA